MSLRAALPLALCAALAGCGGQVPVAAGDPGHSARPAMRPADIPERPQFRPRTLPPELLAEAATFRRVTLTTRDIRWIEVAIYAGNTWVYDEILPARTKFRAVNVPTGYAWVFLAAYDSWGYNVVDNADGYVYSLAYVRDGTLSSLRLNLPLI